MGIIFTVLPQYWGRNTRDSRGGGDHSCGTEMGRYVGFTPMLERTICGFRAGRRGCAASLLCRHINVIKNSDFLSSIVNVEYGPLRCLEAL